MTTLKLKRCYEPPSPDDGYRVYIDRLWPRGLSHDTFHYDTWDREIAPSTALRHYFHENPDTHWGDFEERYIIELTQNPRWNHFADSRASHDVVTLLYSSRNQQENNAVVVVSALIRFRPHQFRKG